MLLRPIGNALLVEVLQVTPARDHRSAWLSFQNSSGGADGSCWSVVNRRIADRTSSLTSSMTVSTLIRPAMWPTKYTSVATQTSARTIPDGQGQVRNKLAFVMGPDAAQHDQGVRECPQKRAQCELIASIPGEVAQQPGAHLSSRQRQGRDGNRKHGACDSDRRGSDRTQQACAHRSRRRRIQPVLEQPLRHDADAIELDEAQRHQHAAEYHHRPEAARMFH